MKKNLIIVIALTLLMIAVGTILMASPAIPASHSGHTWHTGEAWHTGNVGNFLTVQSVDPIGLFTDDPPLCRLIPAVLQNASGGQSTAWFNWCGYVIPDGPNPVRNWVESFTGDGFVFDSSQCPRLNPCTIFGNP